MARALTLLWVAFIALQLLPVFVDGSQPSPSAFDEKELQALKDIYNSLGGTGWRFQTPCGTSTRAFSWFGMAVFVGDSVPWTFKGSDLNPCTPHRWWGVTCSPTNNTIISVNLNSYGLRGTLSSSISQLSNLQSLNLANNFVSGSIPDAIGGLKSLTFLGLHICNLNGILPHSLWSLTGLIQLRLYENSLTGTLSSAVRGVRSIVNFNIDTNHFTGTLPEELYTLNKLMVFSITSNDFTGSISPSIRALSPSLKYLTMAYNKLTSTMPRELYTLTNLVDLELSNNRLSGTLSSEILSLSGLQILMVNSNLMVGKIPQELYQLSLLNNLELSGNRLTGSLSSAIGGLTALTKLSLFSNLLTSTLPTSAFAKLSALRWLSLASNHLEGKLNVLGSLKLLADVSLNDNRFTGQLTGWLDLMPSLRTVDLSQNYFSGRMTSSSLSSLTNLISFAASQNRLSGPIANALAFFPTSIQRLHLSSNRLTGSLYSHLGQLRNLIDVDLSANSLDGPLLSTSLCSLTGIHFLDLSRNVFTGPVPSCLAKLHFLRTLLLAQNRLTNAGGNMNGFAFMLAKNLSVVDISSNRLGGTLPVSAFLKERNDLKIFAATANCFYGPLPVEICTATKLHTLILDGLSEGECPKTTWVGKEKMQMTGGIPSCLFALPYLRILHLSGNGFAGSFVPPHVDAWPPSLSDLDVSNNRLTSSIPLHLQQSAKQFTSFDASFNKLNGLVDSMQITNHTKIRFKVNRFSGLLSPSVTAAGPGMVSVLEGNLLDCVNDDEKKLPLNDPYRYRFKCGSSTFNDYMMAFTALVSCAFALLAYTYGPSINRTLEIANPDCITAVSERKFPFIVLLLETLGRVRYFCYACLAMFIVPLLPLYLGLSSSNGTHTYEYAWAISAAFKGGVGPAAGLFLTWTAFLLFAFHCLNPNFKRDRALSNSNLPVGESDHNDDKLRPTIDTLKAGESQTHSKDTVHGLLYLRLVFIFAVNFTLVMVPNVAYVYIVSKYSGTAQLVSSMFLTTYKLLWNRLLLPLMLQSRNFLFGVNLAEIEQFHYSALRGGLDLEMLLNAFNCFVAPSVSLLVADSNCFSSVMFPPPPVVTSYETDKCKVYDNFYTVVGVSLNGKMLQANSTQTFLICNETITNNVTYQPTFWYSYQCSASLLQYYSPVFLLLALMSFVGEHIIHEVIHWTVSQYPDVDAKYGLSYLDPMLLCSATHVLPVSSSRRRSRSVATRPSIGTRLSMVDAQSNTYSVFNVYSCFMAIFSFFFILVSFGIAAPLLGFTIVVALVSKTVHLHHLIVTFANSDDELDAGGVKNLENDCREFMERQHPFTGIRYMIVIFASVFLSSFLLDIAGDEAGWREAIWAPMLMILVPVSLACLLDYYTPTGRLWMPGTAAAAAAAATSSNKNAGAGAGAGAGADAKGAGAGANDGNDAEKVVIMDDRHAEGPSASASAGAEELGDGDVQLSQLILSTHTRTSSEVSAPTIDFKKASPLSASDSVSVSVSASVDVDKVPAPSETSVRNPLSRNSFSKFFLPSGGVSVSTLSSDPRARARSGPLGPGAEHAASVKKQRQQHQ